MSINEPSTLPPDSVVDAQSFITALTRDPEAPITWQVLRDAPFRPEDRHLYNMEYQGTLAHLEPTLRVWNSRGCGIFYMVNGGDGGHRSAAAVTSLRALFIDDDKSLLSEGSFRPLAPSAIVRSRRGLHAYWFLLPGQPLYQFTGAQKALIRHFGSDPAIHDLPRLMRMPGFKHCKDPAAEVPVRLTSLRPEARYSIDEVLGAYGLTAAAAEQAPRLFQARNQSRQRTPGAGTGPGESAALLAILDDSDLLFWARESARELRYPAWRGIGTNLAAAALEGPPEAMVEAECIFADLEKFHEGAGPYSRAERRQAWGSIVQSARSFGPATWDHLTAGGVPVALAEGAPTRSPLGDARLRHASNRMLAAAEALASLASKGGAK